MNLKKLIEASKEIRARYICLKKRTEYLQRLAIEARKGNIDPESKSKGLADAPEVVDFGGPIEHLVSALEEKGNSKDIQKIINQLQKAEETKDGSNLDEIPPCSDCVKSFGRCTWKRCNIECLSFWKRTKRKRSKFNDNF